MSERSIRVNELILRELSHILRTRFRDQTVAITLTEVNVSPDLRSGRVYYSVIGDERAKIKARSFFTKEYRTLRQLVAQTVILKYFPKLNFMEDDSIARGNRVLDLLGEIDGQERDTNAYAPEIEDIEDENAERPEYAFDEDDLEYARDLEGGGNVWSDFADDEPEEFDEAADVEYDGDPDDEDGDEFDDEDEESDEEDDFDDEDAFDDEDDDEDEEEDVDEDDGLGKNRRK